MVKLDKALERFAQEEPEKAQLVKGISHATASEYWTYACAWLHDVVSTD
jgi:hypothetical protein